MERLVVMVFEAWCIDGLADLSRVQQCSQVCCGGYSLGAGGCLEKMRSVTFASNTVQRIEAYD